MSETLTVGFLPLVDAALPILAQVHGFAEDEGVTLNLVRDMSWATVLDRLLYGHSDAAHMVAPLAIATSIGLNRPARPLSVPFVLGLNGNAITLANDLAMAVQPDYALGEPRAVGERLAVIARSRAADGRPIRFGVVHRYSSHNYMLRYWLAECGIVPDRDVEIVTVSPPYAAAALAEGEIDGICVGEPWNSVAVEQGVGRIVLATAQIWRRGVEKVLAIPECRLADKREAVERLIRAMRRAGRHFIDPANFETNAAILARPEFLGGDAGIILRAISDRLLIARGGEPVHFADFMFQHREAANFPWVSQAQWLYTQLVRWHGGRVNPADAAVAARVFRPDIYRSALAGRDSPLPGASAKVEGAIGRPLPVGSVQGRLTLSNDSFFDGRQFDPNDLQGYLSTLP